MDVRAPICIIAALVVGSANASAEETNSKSESWTDMKFGAHKPDKPHTPFSRLPDRSPAREESPGAWSGVYGGVNGGGAAESR
jgi:hypothetical protein